MLRQSVFLALATPSPCHLYYRSSLGTSIVACFLPGKRFVCSKLLTYVTRKIISAGGHHDHSHPHSLAHAEEAIHDHDHRHHDHAHDHLEGFTGEGMESLKHGHDALGAGEPPGLGGEGHGHGHGMSDLLLPLLVLAGFMLFFISERLVRALAGGMGHSHHGHSHGGIGSNASNDVSRTKKDDDYVPDAAAGGGRGPKLKIAGILNLAADALHNLSDGIAIGAAFASGSGLGYSTALATLLHELPHEIGDFAVLVQSGMG